MDLHDKIGQMLMVGFHGLEAPAYLLDWLREGRIGGVILFARNVESPEQVARLTTSLHAAAKYPLLIGIDQEGGTVARLRQSQGFSESPGAMALSSAADGAALAEQVDQMLAEEMCALGINWDFAPVLDITYNHANASVGTRSFGMDRARVAQMGSAAVRGFQRGGVAACAKHFPGLGTTSTDTHVALPILDTPLETLAQQDMEPFKSSVSGGIASVMTTHTIFSALDARLPATLSPVIIRQLLREKLGFDGVVASDCMEMKAIADHWGAGETAVLGALAGLDVILFSHTRELQEAAHDALFAAAQSGRVPIEQIDEANRRVAALKAAYPAHNGDLSVIRPPDHVELTLRAARAGTTLLRAGGLLPLSGNAALVEFPSNLESGIVESGGLTGFASALRPYFPDLPMMALTSANVEQARQIAQSAGTLVLATRNAHLNPDSVKFAQELINTAQQTVLVCLRAPYDAGKLAGAQTVICTCGDSAPSLQAAAEVLAGQFTPTGKLPVTIE
ncbi:MAG TPA: beta-N-acetylhexosaminidase [Phototrophicaceae bacterium]|nr:beta-N-acetylhexosaminidase [Phototrophicaceae bacterium]